MVRAFIAVDISQDAKNLLERTIAHLQQEHTNVRWVRPESVHITLKFLGDIDVSIVDTLLGAMATAAHDSRQFTIGLSQTGVFPNPAKARVLWVGLDGELEHLNDLQKRIDDQLYIDCGIPKETRPFNPHLTLGRIRDNAPPEARSKAAEAVLGADLGPKTSWTVKDIHLVQSTLTPSGAYHQVLGSVPL